MTAASDALHRQGTAIIGEHVHTIMWRQGRTQKQLAAVLGVDQGSVSKRLHGKTAWTAVELAITAAWLGVPMSELLPEVEFTPGDDDPTTGLRIISTELDGAA